MAIIRGTNGADALRGTLDADVIFGFDGNDTIHAKARDDTVLGGAGDDHVLGELGNDWLIGGTGNDALTGGQGDDYLSGGAGQDQLIGLEGDDICYGGTGNDFLGGGPGDLLYGGAGDDTIFCGNVDFYTAGWLFGGSGNDSLRGGFGVDHLQGGAGGDLFDPGVDRFDDPRHADYIDMGDDQVPDRLTAIVQPRRLGSREAGGLGIDVVRNFREEDELSIFAQSRDRFGYDAGDYLDSDRNGVIDAADLDVRQEGRNLVLDIDAMIDRVSGAPQEYGVQHVVLIGITSFAADQIL